MDYQKEIKKCKKHPLIDVNSPTLQKVDYHREDIYKILPNREPFLFIDKITGVDLSEKATIGIRKISEDDPALKGHFPGNPVYPGVLQLEMIAEMFCCLFYFVTKNTYKADKNDPVRLVATRMHDCYLQHGIFPGDEVTIITKVLDLNELTYTGIGQIRNGDKTAVAVVGEFYIL